MYMYIPSLSLSFIQDRIHHINAQHGPEHGSGLLLGHLHTKRVKRAAHSHTRAWKEYVCNKQCGKPIDASFRLLARTCGSFFGSMTLPFSSSTCRHNVRVIRVDVCASRGRGVTMRLPRNSPCTCNNYVCIKNCSWFRTLYVTIGSGSLLMNSRSYENCQEQRFCVR